MIFSTTFAALTTLLTLTTASPNPASAAAAKPARFHIKTRVTSPGSQYGGYYVVPFHTGAGTSAARLFDHNKFASPSYLNDTALLFDQGKGAIYQAGATLRDSSLSDGWGFVTIDLGASGTKGFKIENGTLVPSTYVKFKSGELSHFPPWRACDWNHGGPEIFWNNFESDDYRTTEHIPISCSLVDLVPEYL